MKVIVAGSRSITDYEAVATILDQYHQVISEVVCGTASGVDSIGVMWAMERHISVAYFPANWRPDGVFDRSAGYKRNQRMAEYADALIAFWDGVSRGTNHMLNIMKNHNKPFRLFIIS